MQHHRRLGVTKSRHFRRLESDTRVGEVRPAFRSSHRQERDAKVFGKGEAVGHL